MMRYGGIMHPRLNCIVAQKYSDLCRYPPLITERLAISMQYAERFCHVQWDGEYITTAVDHLVSPQGEKFWLNIARGHFELSLGEPNWRRYVPTP